MIMEAGWILLVVAVSGALAFCLLHSFNREEVWETKRLFAFLTVCFFGLLQAVLVETGWRDRWFSGERAEPWLTAAFSKISHPRLETALQSAPTDEEKSLLRWALAFRGSQRLGPEANLRRSRLMAKLLSESNETICAALFRGNPDPRSLRASLEKLNDSDLKEWIELSVLGAKAFLNGSPAPALGQNEMEITLRKVAQVTPAEDYERAMQALTQRNVASDAEVCWSARRLHKTLAELPTPYSQALALLLNL